MTPPTIADTPRTATDASPQPPRRRAAPIPLVAFAASLLCTGGGQWLNRSILKATAAPTILWVVVQRFATTTPAAVTIIVVALAAEATITAVRRHDTGQSLPPNRPLIAAAAALAPTLPPVLLGAQPGLIIGAGQLYNGYVLRAAFFSTCWWAALLLGGHQLGYAIYLVPLAATVEAFLVAFARLDRYREANPQ